jgi:NIMA (never in mitosis gene a)-related kinase
MTSTSDEYEALEVIGKGSFGTVRKVRRKSDGEILVRKEIEYTSMNAHERNQIISELRILRELNHEHIVKYYTHDHIMESKIIHIYMEYCDGGDLARVISNFKKSREQVPEEFVWQVLVQTLLALYRCHYGVDAPKVNLFSEEEPEEPNINSDTVIIHRDIKPDNIFLLNEGKTVKVGDFGLAKMLTSQNDFAKTYVGTPYYMSPEVLMDNPYSPVCDIWSLGCVLFELCHLKPPFQAKTHLNLQAKIKQGVVPEIPSTYSIQLRSIIKQCITVDPEVRPTTYELLNSLAIKFLRKELELKEVNRTLQEFQKQLLSKSEELDKKEARIKNMEQKMKNSSDDDYDIQALKRTNYYREELGKKLAYINNLENKFSSIQLEFEEKYNKLLKKFSLQQKQLEDEYKEEFEIRKRQMDLENKEVRLGYQREFKLVVEQEVEKRVKDIMANGLSRKTSDPTSRQQPTLISHNEPIAFHNKPKGPRELEGISRTPLKLRNDDPNQYQYKTSSTPPRNIVQKKRVTDELQKLSLVGGRHTPEFEDVYMRNQHRY